MKEILDIPIFYYICDKNIRRCIMADKKNTLVFLHSLMLKDYKCFKGDNSFLFGTPNKKGKVIMSQCTVFLGNNGTGKTNLLKLIANISPEIQVISDKELVGNNGRDNIPDYCIRSNISFGNESKVQNKKIEKSVVYRPSVVERYAAPGYNVSALFSCCDIKGRSAFTEKFSIVEKDRKEFDLGNGTKRVVTSYAGIGYTNQSNTVVYDVNELDKLKIYAYGINRFSDTQRSLVSDNCVDSLFRNNVPLINLEEWLLQLEMAKGKKPGVGKRIKLIKRILKLSNLFPDIEDYYIHIDDNYNSEVLFKTREGDLRLNELGYGYQCMFAWVFDFMKKMFDRYSKSNNPLEEPAVLLIDEIDLHLHPQWQRHVIKDLCELFPNTQMIVTTHSPLVIQSIDNINLFILSKEDDHTKVTHCTEKTFQGWTIEEILQELMDLDENIRSEEYLLLIRKIHDALSSGNSENANKFFDKLKEILHPNSIDREIIQMQIEAVQDHD